MNDDQPPTARQNRKLVLPSLPSGNKDKVETVSVQVGNQKVEVRAGPRATGGDEVAPDLGGLPAGIWAQGFNATEGRWNAATKTWDEVPDIKMRMKTMELWLAYRHGLPIQRQVRVQQGFVDLHAELLEIASTEHGRRMLMAMGAIDAQWEQKYLPAPV